MRGVGAKTVGACLVVGVVCVGLLSAPSIASGQTLKDQIVGACVGCRRRQEAIDVGDLGLLDQFLAARHLVGKVLVRGLLRHATPGLELGLEDLGGPAGRALRDRSAEHLRVEAFDVAGRETADIAAARFPAAKRAILDVLANPPSLSEVLKAIEAASGGAA